MVVSIHQPNYLPWLGYFDKIANSDIFVIFDNVQYPRGKNHFGNRNKIKTNTGDKWLTVSLLGKSELKNFNQIQLNTNGWEQEHIRLIENFYKKSPYFDKYFDNLKNILQKKYTNLSELNIELLQYFISQLDIDTKIILSSDICSDNISGDQRILYILEKLNCSSYISGTGPGSLRYIKEDDFKQRNIELIWQHYSHPVYNQQYGEFIPYMSIIDLLFNEGPNSKNIV